MRSPPSTASVAASAQSTAERAASYVPAVSGVVVSKHHHPSRAATLIGSERPRSPGMANTSGTTSCTGRTSRWYSCHADSRKRTSPASCTASIGAVPVGGGSLMSKVASAASAARIASARPGCSNGGCRPDDSISCSGSCWRWRSDAKTRITPARAAPRGRARGTSPAAACPTTSSAACSAGRASRRAAAARRPRACGGGWRGGSSRGRHRLISATTTTLSLPL